MGGEPSRIGRYVIEGALGRGAMGVILRAHDPAIARTVAIKLIRADLLDGGDRDDFIARFQREAQAAGRCIHPNIVSVFDVGVHEGNPFLVMEFVPGASLAQVQAGPQPLSAGQGVEVVRQLLAALGAAHALGVTHRDVKPANILLAESGQVKVADFGIARLDTAALTQEGSVIGTPSYMSPEQLRGEAVDARSDLFCAGVVLFELLCGHKPFTGRSPSELWHRMLHDDPLQAPAAQALPPALHAVLARALAKDARQRFASAAEMAAALHSGRDDQTVVLPAAPPPAIAPEVAQDLERKLAEHVGPIARLLVQSGLSQAGTLEALCTSLASSIVQTSGREAFERDARTIIARSAAPPRGALAADALDRAQAELTRHLGPVARVLVKRAAAVATTEDDLWQTLARHIDRPADRAAFLSKRQPSRAAP